MAKRKQNGPQRLSFETFREVGAFERSSLKRDDPSCFNGWVNYRKWRVTFEPVDEPIEVLQARVQELWENETNSHHRFPLRAAAKELGFELQGDMGAKARARPRG